MLGPMASMGHAKCWVLVSSMRHLKCWAIVASTWRLTTWIPMATAGHPKCYSPLASVCHLICMSSTRHLECRSLWHPSSPKMSTLDGVRTSSKLLCPMASVCHPKYWATMASTSVTTDASSWSHKAMSGTTLPLLHATI